MMNNREELTALWSTYPFTLLNIDTLLLLVHNIYLLCIVHVCEVDLILETTSVQLSLRERE